MGTTYSSFLKSNEHALDARRARLETLIAQGLQQLEQREEAARKAAKLQKASKKRKLLAGAPVDSAVVDAAAAQHLDEAKARAKATARAAFAQMATRPLQEGRLERELPGGRSYSMPLLYSDVLVDKNDLYEMGKEYVSKSVLPDLDERRAAVRQVASKGLPFAVGDSHGRLSAVVVPHAFSAAARLGRRALVALQLLGDGGGYMMCCQGSGNVESQSPLYVYFISTCVESVMCAQVHKVFYVRCGERTRVHMCGECVRVHTCRERAKARAEMNLLTCYTC
jgi:hypothetical protein